MNLIEDLINAMTWHPHYRVIAHTSQFERVRDVIEANFPPTEYDIELKSSEYVTPGQVIIVDEHALELTRQVITLPPIINADPSAWADDILRGITNT